MLILGLSVAVPAAAQTPSPIDPTLFSFPGGFINPPSATSAGLALADRWLGDEPYINPAAPRAERVILGPALLHTSRQDLRAGNRNFDERSAVVDGAGAALGLPYLPVWLYVHQPVLRFDDYSFNRGNGFDPNIPPATIRGQADVRETRAGAAASAAVARVRLGGAVEWTRRDDRYQTDEQSGAPDQGQRLVEFDGSGVGWAVGVHYDTPDSGAHSWTMGAALRSIPKLEVSGQQTLDLLSGSSTAAVAAVREAGWEGGVSTRYALTQEFSMTAGFGGTSEQKWEGFGITNGATTAWAVGGLFHDARDPWTLRFGVGQEQQTGVPETRAGSLGLGLGWDMEGVVLDFGLLHRGIERPGRPRSYDDRVVGSVRVDF
jgi:hypothetical protein